jgi:hypothetical protein
MRRWTRGGAADDTGGGKEYESTVRRKNIIRVAIFLGVAALLFGAWHFLVRERMKKYNDDKERLTQLSELSIRVSDRFARFRPEHVVGVFEEQVAPWEVASESRSRFYFSGYTERVAECPHDDPVLIRPWYEEQIFEEIRRLETDMAQKWYPPPGVDFGVLTARETQGREVNKLQAMLWLAKQERGAAMVRRLLDANVPIVRSVQMAERPTQMGIFLATFFVLGFYADLNTLSGLLNDFSRGDLANVREGEHFFNVPAIRIQNPNLSYAQPLLDVQMVVVEVDYNPRAAVVPLASPEERLAVLGGARTRDDDEELMQPKRTWWQRFRRNWLPF